MEYIKSYAKINWVLEILNKRPDNYHNISSIFEIINLYDEINIEIQESYQWDLKISCNIKELEKNNILFLVFDLLSSIKKEKKYEIKIDLFKNIPIGGGLGGGSSNAATIIFFLYKKNIIDFINAIKICKSCGSDVLPIFLSYLYPGTYIFCFERQNICIPIHKAHKVLSYSKFLYKEFQRNLYLIFPKISIDTGYAYQEYDSLLNERNILIGPITYRFFRFIRTNLFYDYFLDLLHNDFEKVIYKLYPSLGELREKIYANLGTDGIKVLLCGSGSTLAIIANHEIDLSFLGLQAIKIKWI